MNTTPSQDRSVGTLKKYFAVEYAGWWNIQEGQYYGDKNILNAEDVGEDMAEQNAKLIVRLLNEHYAQPIPVSPSKPTSEELQKWYIEWLRINFVKETDIRFYIVKLLTDLINQK